MNYKRENIKKVEKNHSYIKSSSDTANHIEKKDNDGKSIKSKYVLDYFSTFSDFKIKDYTDI